MPLTGPETLPQDFGQEAKQDWAQPPQSSWTLSVPGGARPAECASDTSLALVSVSCPLPSPSGQGLRPCGASGS